MAYYHRKITLNRFERFELSADLRASQVKTTTDKKQHSADYGSGIAAQFGLIKKVYDGKCKKISDEVSLQGKKDAYQEKKPVTISKPNPRDKINYKRLRKLSTDDKVGTSRGKNSSPEDDSSSPNRKHGKLKKCGEINKAYDKKINSKLSEKVDKIGTSRDKSCNLNGDSSPPNREHNKQKGYREVKNPQDKNINSKLSKKISIYGKIGTSTENSSTLDEDFLPPTKHNISREDKKIKMNKGKGISLPKEMNLPQSKSNITRVRNESLGNIDRHISNSNACMRSNAVSSHEVKRTTVNTYTAKRCKRSEVENSGSKSSNEYSDSNSTENHNNDVNQSVKRCCMDSNNLRNGNVTRTNDLFKKHTSAYDETIKNENKKCTGKQFFNGGDGKSIISVSAPKKDNEKKKEKHKTFTIPKVNMVIPLDYKGSSSSSVTNEEVVIDEEMNIRLKEQKKRRRSSVYVDNNVYVKRKNNIYQQSVENFIKRESIEDEDVDCIPYPSFRIDQGENIQNESNNNIDISNVTSSKSMDSAKSHHISESCSAKITNRQCSDHKSKKNVNIVSDTNYSKASKSTQIKPLTNNVKDRPISIATQTDLLPSNVTDISINAEVEKGTQIIINMGFEQEEYFFKSCRKIKDCKGGDLIPWFSFVIDGLRPKLSKTDNSNLNYFITLHSRFMVMETMEMNDLEVLPEHENEDGIGSEPIRIFTNLSKDHYKQYLDESCLNSIPELIVTRLYQA